MIADKSPLENLADDLLLLEERKESISKGSTKSAIEHSLTLHRSTTSVAEIKAMIRTLEAAGMPEDASLSVRVEHQFKTTQLYARWKTPEPDVPK